MTDWLLTYYPDSYPDNLAEDNLIEIAKTLDDMISKGLFALPDKKFFKKMIHFF